MLKLFRISEVQNMKAYTRLILTGLFIVLPQITSLALPMNENVVKHFKKVISECVFDALNIIGEYKNNAYYVNLNCGSIKNFQFNNAIVKFQDISEKGRNALLDSGAYFPEINKYCKIKVAADLSAQEIQAIIDSGINRPATSKRVINKAVLTFEDNAVSVDGTINMKKIPGNPLAMLSNDEFIPFNAKFSVYLKDSCVFINILEGNVNGQEMTPEVINMFHAWLNPLWDFTKLDFPCGIQEYSISPSGLRIAGYIF